MELTVKEAARILGVSEKTVRHYISSGKLPARRKGRQFMISKDALARFVQPLREPEQPEKEPLDAVRVAVSRHGLKKVNERLARMEAKFKELFAENRRLARELREKEQILAQKEMEIDKLQRDLVYQKRVHEKELEDHRKLLEEKWNIAQQQMEEKLALERQRFEEKLARERDLWAERLEQEKERACRRIEEALQQESFWAKLVKMMTWS